MIDHLKVITEPTAEPIELSNVKQFLRIDHMDEDLLISGMISAAREHSETFTRRSLALKKYELTVNDFRERISLPKPPFVSLDKIIVKDIDGNELIVSDYLISGSEYIDLLIEWPNVELYPVDAIKIQYQSGYEELPKPIEQAMLLMISHFYTNRETVVVGTSVAKMPFSVETLLNPYKVRWF